MNQVILKPIYSSPATEIPENLNLPENWMLSWHQLETTKAIADPKIDIIFNTALTGDGKSLAAYLQTLQGDSCVMGLYPTNELIRDQDTQIKGYIEKFQPANDPRINLLTSLDLENYAEEETLSKAGAIASRTYNSEILLTNPDIFHYLHQGAYLTPYDNPDKLWNSIDKLYNLFIFDEFHVFQTPQISSILNIMLLIRRTNRQKNTSFFPLPPMKNYSIN